MGGHGGLNILPQKKWNVYNFENREKVRKDEEAAAKEEQIKREQSRKRDAEFRLQKLRFAKGIQPPLPDHPSSSDLPFSSSIAVETATTTTTTTTNDSNHINLFEGLRVFPYLGEIKENGGRDLEEEKGFKRKKLKREEEKKKKKEDKVVVSAEDEKYKLGYGLAGKGVKLPWYLSKKTTGSVDGDDEIIGGKKDVKTNKSGKKTVEELREERLKREKREKERELALVREKNKRRDGIGYKEKERGNKYYH